ncbi:MAG: DUF3429 domain-containing protein [Pseudomonadota bacterium]
MYKLKTPQAPLALTTAGMIPFVAIVGIMWVERNDIALLNTAGIWMIVYGAVILSFLGGVRWGVEMSRRDKPRFGELVLSILGALIGWGLVLAFFRWGHPAVFPGMAAALLFYFGVDRMSGEMPIWYRKLRVWPTGVAVLSLIGAYLLLRGG